MRFLILISTVLVCGVDCQPLNKSDASDVEGEAQEKQRHVALDNGNFFEKDGMRYLFGGENEFQHFNITNYHLKDAQFHYGIGREKFLALLQSKFINAAIADTIFADSTRFLLLHKDDVTKAYSIKDLARHEVVNDEINGKPIMFWLIRVLSIIEL